MMNQSETDSAIPGVSLPSQRRAGDNGWAGGGAANQWCNNDSGQWKGQPSA